MPELFLVSTTHHLLALDGQGRFYRIHSGRGLYYGLAKYEDKIYVACRNQVEGPQDANVRANEEGSILVFDAVSLLLIGELELGFALRDVHGIECSDGRLRVTCSFDNLVAIYDLASRSWSKWYPSKDIEARGRDVNHFNTLLSMGDRLCLLAHNNGPSHLLFYEKSSLELCSAIELGSQAHDIFFHESNPATCSSGEGLLTDSAGWALRTGGFPRGIAFGDDANHVGISQRSTRSKRHETTGVIRTFSPDWRFSSDSVLAGAGMILAIARIDLPIEAVANLEPWHEVQTVSGAYNDVEPGNIYRIGHAGNMAITACEWHAAEETHRWSAARDSRLSVIVNPGESEIRISAISLFPQPYGAEVLANGHFIGALAWTESGDQSANFRLPAGLTGRCELTFRVPHLWRPSTCLPGNQDERLLGIGLRTVTISPELVLSQIAPV